MRLVSHSQDWVKRLEVFREGEVKGGHGNNGKKVRLALFCLRKADPRLIGTIRGNQILVQVKCGKVLNV